MDLINGFRKIISAKDCEDEKMFFRLEGAGLVKREGEKVVPRNRLYEKYFKEKFHV